MKNYQITINGKTFIIRTRSKRGLQRQISNIAKTAIKPKELK